jgi:hypothetical protein
MESPVIVLESTHLIGEGRMRWCYRHPQDPGKCIKIDKPNTGGATEKEVFYYRKLRWFRSSLSCTHVPRFHGTVEPNMGRGGVSDLIRDETTGHSGARFFKMVSAPQDPAALQMGEVRFARGNSREPQEQEGQSLGFKGMWNKPVSCP